MEERVNKFFEEIKEKLSIDQRFIVFEYSIAEDGKRYHVALEMSDKKLSKVIKKLFHPYFNDPKDKIKINISVLPDLKKNVREYCIGSSSFSPMYKLSSNKSEMITQLLLGETCTILKVSNDGLWYLVKLHHDGYIGWVSPSSIQVMNDKELKKWLQAKKVTIIKKAIEIWNEPNYKAEVIRYSTIGVKLPKLKEYNGFISVLLPDHKIGWVPEGSVKATNDLKMRGSKKIIKTAKLFLGTAYQWGGRTPLGVDCSGFVQTVFNFNGYNLPRDANLQFKTGIDIGKDFEKFLPGDLLFFGAENLRPSHVGIYLSKDMKFIHSSGFVRYGSLDKNSEIFDKRLSGIFIGARRVLNR